MRLILPECQLIKGQSRHHRREYKGIIGINQDWIAGSKIIQALARDYFPVKVVYGAWNIDICRNT